MIVCLVFHQSLLSLIFGKIDSQVMKNAQIYFMVSAISYPFISLFNGGAALFRAMGNSKISMYNSIITNTINIIGNAILIYIFKLGVLGAALSTLFSRIIGAISMLYMLRNESLVIHVRQYRTFNIDFKMIKTILQIDIPTGLENGMFQIGKILVAGIVTSFGTAAIAANAVANNLVGLEIIPGAAMGLAMVTVVGQCVGANDYKAANDAKFTMSTSILSMWIFRIGLCLIFANYTSLGVIGVWFAMFSDWLFRAMVFTWRQISGKWQEKN